MDTRGSQGIGWRGGQREGRGKCVVTLGRGRETEGKGGREIDDWR